MQEYVIVPSGIHLLELIRRNPIKVAGAIDFRNNDGLVNAGIDQLSPRVHRVGAEHRIPFYSIRENISYYKKINKLLELYAQCKVIISNNYTPLSRFIIDRAGVDRVELWEDGMNHYIKLEQITTLYRPKCLYKLLCGFYPKNIFNTAYQHNKLTIKDRYFHHNLEYDRPTISGSAHYYIGQPLIEDHLLLESTLKEKMKKLFDGKQMLYLPHPREQKRPWLNDIFTVLNIQQTAESYLLEHGANGVHSAFSTVNLNLDCNNNVYYCNYLGLNKIADKLQKYKFGVTFV